MWIWFFSFQKHILTTIVISSSSLSPLPLLPFHHTISQPHNRHYYCHSTTVTIAFTIPLPRHLVSVASTIIILLSLLSLLLSLSPLCCLHHRCCWCRYHYSIPSWLSPPPLFHHYYHHRSVPPSSLSSQLSLFHPITIHNLKNWTGHWPGQSIGSLG